MTASLLLPPRDERVRATKGVRDVVTARCVVVGAGSIGRRHLRNLTTLGIEAIALRTHQGQSGPLDGWRAVTSWDEVAEFAPSLAIIANPTARHVDAAVEATRRRCHVLIEKPVAERLESVMHLQSAVAKRGTTALVGYQFRFHPTLRTVREWIKQGLIGEPVSAHAHWGEYLPDWHPTEDHLKGYSARRELGGGAVLTLSHPIDYVRWLLGEVREVSALTSRSSELTMDVEDVAALTLRMTSGVLATITLDYLERPARHSLQITGREGTVCWDAMTGVARLRTRNATELTATPAVGFERNAMFVDELTHFLACVRGEATPCCTLADGARAVLIAESALRSARERRVIHV